MEYKLRGERVRQLREDLNMTQGELADAIVLSAPGVNQSHISQIERGVAGLRPESLAAVAVALETSVDYLLGLTDDPTRREDMAEQVILVEKNPGRRELLQRLFTAIERMPAPMRDQYLETLTLLYQGVMAAAREDRDRRNNIFRKSNDQPPAN